ncbi:ABC transporter permease [bacterium]|nr:MAG: ABC transporter permease [bacterium]
MPRRRASSESAASWRRCTPTARSSTLGHRISTRPRHRNIRAGSAWTWSSSSACRGWSRSRSSRRSVPSNRWLSCNAVRGSRCSPSRPPHGARSLRWRVRRTPTANGGLLQQALSYALLHRAELLAQTRTHVELAFGALALAIVLAYPLGVWISGRRRISAAALGTASALRVVPSLGILALLLPVLGVGTPPSLVALVILALPPILVNVDAGYRGVEPAALDAAAAMGMTRWQLFLYVQTPLALPVFLTGVRGAVVEVVASATLAAFIGGGGLGETIITGMQVDNQAQLLVGGLLVALLALSAELLIVLIERSIPWRRMRHS